MKDRDNLYRNIKSALLIALISLSSYLYLPLPTASGLSLQTVFLNLTALILPAGQSFLTVCVWIIMGAVGLPVFSGGGGMGKLFGLTGGFYWGFLVAVPLMSIAKGRKITFTKYLTACLTGLVIEHIFAVAVMCLHNDFNLWSAVQSISLPFIVGDILKCVLSAVVGVKVNRRVG